MKIIKGIVLFVSFNFVWSIIAVNHWVLNENGLITAKIDSPFYMREPQNLAMFLDQIKHNEIIETTYLELLRQKESMMEQINHSLRFGMQLMEQVNCAANIEPGSVLTHAPLTLTYLKRFKEKAKYELLVKPNNKPHCEQYVDLNVGMCCFDHLSSLRDPHLLEIDPEEDLNDDELGIDSEYFLSEIVAGLKKDPNSWKYHTLGSYYWRMKGNAYQAVECARRGILLAPREFKDIPLLSLGTILSRADKFTDADIVLNAAVDHAPKVAENHLTLATNQAILHNFNRSAELLDNVKRLDPSYSNKVDKLKEVVLCLGKMEKNSKEIDKNVEYFKKEVAALRLLKNKIIASHEKLIQQQVPLGARYVDKNKGNGPFKHRGQYCSSRTLAGNDEPILFCDFYSDLQMRLESKEVAIEALEHEISSNREALKKRLAFELQTELNFHRHKGKSRRD